MTSNDILSERITFRITPEWHRRYAYTKVRQQIDTHALNDALRHTFEQMVELAEQNGKRKSDKANDVVAQANGNTTDATQDIATIRLDAQGIVNVEAQKINSPDLITDMGGK